MKKEVVSLVKRKQGKFTKKITKIKENVKKGKVIVKETIAKVAKVKPERGMIYIGHLPHGFYEEEMEAYFKQFGKVTNVRVCRSEKTGRSKGYGFIEFVDPDVAKIAAETMDNYLMFKRRLEVKNIEPEKQRKGLFHGLTWTETKYPHKEKLRRLNREKNKNDDEATHLTKAKKQMSKFQKKVKKLAELGIQHNFQPVDIPNGLDGTKQLIEKNEEDSDSEESIIFNNRKASLPRKVKLSAKVKEVKDKSLKTIKKKKNALVGKKDKLLGLSGDKAKLAKSILNDSNLVVKKNIKKGKKIVKK